jgi:DNA modification methylase
MSGIQRIVPVYKTALGSIYHCLAEDFFSSMGKKYKGKVQLILTSPPFPLNTKKKYGNKMGEEYLAWLADFAPHFKNILTDDGSIVIELGNAWEKGEPVMSTLTFKALLKFLENGELHLCQQFICYNPARLPSPAQWVTIERIRVKDAYTQVWWMSPVSRPKADNRQVLKEYSRSMLKLIQTRKYNAGKRPSEHRIGKSSFLKDNKGAIPSNVLTITNTRSSDPYLAFCREKDLQVHPARMPIDLASFFVKFLTTSGDLVLDPFAGSNTTGAACEQLGRKWLAVEPNEEYIKGSQSRFIPK